MPVEADIFLRISIEYQESINKIKKHVETEAFNIILVPVQESQP